MSKRRPTRRISRGIKRRTLGRTLLTLGLLVAGVWVASRWWKVASERRGIMLDIDSGVLVVGKLNVPPSDFTSWGRTFKPGWTLWFGWGSEKNDMRMTRRLGIAGADLTYDDSGTSWLVKVTLWPIPLLLWTPAALLLRSGILARRGANTGTCAKCGYSLAGLAADAPCPECGKGAGTK